jgi:hypothetical protein
MPIGLSQFATTLWSGLAYSQAQNVDGTYTLVENALPGSMKSAPPGLEATLEFNGLYFHDRKVVDKYRVKLMDGLQGADIRDNREANPSDHGETPFDNYLGGRTILITGTVEAHNIGKLRDMQQALRTAMYSMTERPLIFHVGSIQRDVQIYCRLSDKISMPEKQDDNRPFREFSMTLHATDPRFRSVVDRTYSAIFGILDDNSSGVATQWTTVQNTAPTSSGGVLNPVANGASYNYFRNDLGYKPIDNQQTYKFTTPATITANDLVSVILKSTSIADANNELYGYLNFTSATQATLGIFKIVGGAGSSLAGPGPAITVAANTNYWIQSSIVGNLVTLKLFTTDPSGGSGTQLGTTQTYTLTSTDITAFGAGVQGYVGLRGSSASGNVYKIDDWRLEALNLNHQIFNPYNSGNFLALPKVRVYGPMTGVTIRNETLMPDETTTRQIIINGSIPSGRYYEYDAKTGTLVDDLGANKFSQLDTTSKQLQLRDGENLMTIVATSASGITPRFDVIFQDTWI